MKELTVISGKGGTGKTSITASFADLAPKRVIVDADVDAANLFLTLKHEVKEKELFQGGSKAEIDPELCIGCGECFKRCQFDAVVPINDIKNNERANSQNTTDIFDSSSNNTDSSSNNTKHKFIIDQISCEGCGVCVYFCASKAIKFERQICGEKYISDTSNGPMIHARLGIAEENSGLLVSQLRTKAREIAKNQKMPLIITDGPPGIGCPVIASISSSDAILVVTEPTISGMHDMKRVIKLGRQMNAAVYLCINKADLNEEASKEIKNFCSSNNIRFAGEIPFDRAVIESMKAGESLISYSNGAASKAVSNVWNNVNSFLSETKERII